MAVAMHASVVQRCEPLSPEGQTVVHNAQCKVDTQRGWYQAAAAAAAAACCLPQTVGARQLMALHGICLHAFRSTQPD